MVVFGGQPPPGPEGPFLEMSLELTPDAPRQTQQYTSLGFYGQGPNRDQCPPGTTHAQITPDNAMLKACILTPFVGYTRPFFLGTGMGADGIPTGLSAEAKEQWIRMKQVGNQGRGDKFRDDGATGEALLAALRKVGSSPEGAAIGTQAKSAMTSITSTATNTKASQRTLVTIDKNISAMNANIIALLNAFKAANPPAENSIEQEGGRRRTRVKRKGKGKGRASRRR